eukprot:g4366.t1
MSGNSMRRVQHYHTTDSLQHLAIRLELKKLRSGSGSLLFSGTKKSPPPAPSDGAATKEVSDVESPPEEEERNSWSRVFRWQEKVYGPHEIVKYAQKKNQNAGVFRNLLWNRKDHVSSAIEQCYREDLEGKIKSGEDPIGGIRNTMLFTYTDKDNYQSRDIDVPLTTSNHREVSRLSSRIWNDTTESSHFVRERAVKTMNIMVSFCEKPSARSSEETVVEDFEHHEEVLCSIRQYKGTTQLDIQPGFASGTSSNENGDGESGGSLVRVDEGSRGEWIRFENPKTGDEYAYRVLNVSGESASSKMDSTTTAKKQSQSRALARKDKGGAQTSAVVASHLDRSPPKGSTRVYAFVEVVSAHSFGSDPIFVRYDVLLPSRGWTWGSESVDSVRNGITQRVRPRLMWNTLTSNTNDSDDAAWGMTGNVRQEPVAHFCFPIELEFLRENGGGDSAVEEETETPQGSPTAADRRRTRKEEGASRDDDEEDVSTKETDTTKTSDRANETSPQGGDGEEKLTEALAMEEAKRARTNRGTTMRIVERPQIVFQVFARDAIGRVYTKGYGYYKLPISDGIYDLHVHTWKPEGSVKDDMANFLLGGQRQVDDLSYISMPTSDAVDARSILNKFGFRCKSSGRLRVRANVMHQAPAPPKPVVPKPKPKRRPSAIRRSTVDIMAALRKSRQMLTNLRTPKASMRTDGVEGAAETGTGGTKVPSEDSADPFGDDA